MNVSCQETLSEQDHHNAAGWMFNEEMTDHT
jgi:hypothetical protein